MDAYRNLELPGSIFLREVGGGVVGGKRKNLQISDVQRLAFLHIMVQHHSTFHNMLNNIDVATCWQLDSLLDVFVCRSTLGMHADLT